MTNLANRITLARIFLVPVAVFFLLVKLEWGNLIATLIFVIAASTDKLDGYIARKYEQVTNLGKLLDPLADKLLVTAVLIALVSTDDLAPWVAIVIISRELAVTGLRAVAAAEGYVIAAGYWGKFKTVIQIIALTGLMLQKYGIFAVAKPFVITALYLAVAITVASGIEYFVKADKVLHMRKEF